jgi:YHYH protein
VKKRSKNNSIIVFNNPIITRGLTFEVTKMSGIHGATQADKTGLTGTDQGTATSFDKHVADATLVNKTPQNITPSTAITNSKTSNSAVDSTKLPIGGIVSNTVNTKGAAKGQIYVSSQSYNIMKNGTTGNVATGAWINADGKTYDATKKEVVSGSVTWPYQYTTSDNGATRTIKGNTLPSTTTGTYPIDPKTAAYKIDPNPNKIQSEDYKITMPSNPQASATASPLGLGPVGVMTNGGLLYAGVDGKGNDANAYEVQDSNVGHPSETEHYHTHEIPPTLYSEILGQPNQTKLVGYAADGYAIVAETGSDGKLLSTAQLDNFHGNTSTYVDENGKSVTSFHYTVSQDWPYTIGAFKGTPSTFEGLNTVPSGAAANPPSSTGNSRQATMGTYQQQTSGNTQPTTIGNSRQATMGTYQQKTSGNAQPTTIGNSRQATMGTYPQQTSGNTQPTTTGSIQRPIMRTYPQQTSGNSRSTTTGTYQLSPMVTYQPSSAGKYQTSATGSYQPTVASNPQTSTLANKSSQKTGAYPLSSMVSYQPSSTGAYPSSLFMKKPI